MVEYGIFYYGDQIVPEHFVALIKQYANLNNNEQAIRVAQEISEGLQLTLSADESKLFFTYAPSYLLPRKVNFYSRMFDWNKAYQHMALLERIQVLQNLTDEKEAETRLRSYFLAVKIVSSESNYRNICKILPTQLQPML